MSHFHQWEPPLAPHMSQCHFICQSSLLPPFTQLPGKVPSIKSVIFTTAVYPGTISAVAHVAFPSMGTTTHVSVSFYVPVIFTTAVYPAARYGSAEVIVPSIKSVTVTPAVYPGTISVVAHVALHSILPTWVSCALCILLDGSNSPLGTCLCYLRHCTSIQSQSKANASDLCFLTLKSQEPTSFAFFQTDMFSGTYEFRLFPNGHGLRNLRVSSFSKRRWYKEPTSFAFFQTDMV